MPAKSKAQQSAAAMALACHEGKIPLASLKGAAKNMYYAMNAEQLREFSATKRKRLPKHKR